jgi:hypothetical protein
MRSRHASKAQRRHRKTTPRHLEAKPLREVARRLEQELQWLLHLGRQLESKIIDFLISDRVLKCTLVLLRL